MEVRATRSNGFGRPFNTYQVVSWVLFGVNVLTFIFELVPRNEYMPGVYLGLIAVTFLIFSIGTAIYAISCTKQDPTDRNVLYERK